MSTHAIIGFIEPLTGVIYGGWQWSDGGNASPILRKYFLTLPIVQELVKQGAWSSLLSPRDSYLKWFRERPNDYIIKQVGKCWVAKQKDLSISSFKEAKDGVLVYKSIIDAYGQDINYLYLFNPLNNKWYTFSRIYYKNFKAEFEKIPSNKMAEYIIARGAKHEKI